MLDVHRSVCIALVLVISCVGAACSDSQDTGASGAGGPGGAGGSATSSYVDRVDVPIDGVSAAEEKAFFDGDDLFEVPLREADGLGPLYTRSSCSACHEGGLRGAGSVQKMAVVLADGFTPSPDQSLLPWGNSEHPLLAGGGMTPILAPDDPNVRVSVRVGPPVIGRGYMEAVDESELVRVEMEQAARSDAIHGRVSRVVYVSEVNPDPTFNTYKKGDMAVGRFGLKARQPTLDDFAADALQGDMGITSPLRPKEFTNPDGLTDDLKAGLDATADDVNSRAMYMRLIAIPDRRGLTDQGRALFDKALCSVCHAPTLKTRADYPIKLLAGIDAPIFTDMLLHDMGPALADGVVDFNATSSEWRTSPLIGLRFYKTFLHDGRASTIEEAILLHGGDGSQAAGSIGIYSSLSSEDHDALLAFVSAL